MAPADCVPNYTFCPKLYTCSTFWSLECATSTNFLLAVYLKIVKLYCITQNNRKTNNIILLFDPQFIQFYAY